MHGYDGVSKVDGLGSVLVPVERISQFVILHPHFYRFIATQKIIRVKRYQPIRLSVNAFAESKAPRSAERYRRRRIRLDRSVQSDCGAE